MNGQVCCLGASNEAGTVRTFHAVSGASPAVASAHERTGKGTNVKRQEAERNAKSKIPSSLQEGAGCLGVSHLTVWRSAWPPGESLRQREHDFFAAEWLVRPVRFSSLACGLTFFFHFLVTLCVCFAASFQIVVPEDFSRLDCISFSLLLSPPLLLPCCGAGAKYVTV